MDTINWITLGTGLIAGLGIGTAVTAVIQHALKIKESSFQSQRQDLEKRYRVIILLMYASLEFNRNKTTLHINRPDLEDQQSVLDELKAEWTNMLLFASKETLYALENFIKYPDKENLQQTALSMRQDLGRGLIKLN